MRLKPLFFSLILFTIAVNISAQTLNKNIPIPNGPVLSTVLQGDTAYIYGEFNKFGYSAKHLCRFISDTPKYDPDFPQLSSDSYIGDIIHDGKNGFYIAGSLKNYNGTPLNPDGLTSLIHVFSNYDLDTNFVAPLVGGSSSNTQISCLKLKGSRIYVGGSFVLRDSINLDSNIRQYLMALDSKTGKLITWKPSSIIDITNGIEVYDTTVIANTYTNLVALSANSGNIIKSFPNADRPVTAMKVNNQKLYIGGGFSDVGNSTSNIIKIDADNLSEMNLPKTDGEVSCTLPDSSGGFYIGGGFYTINDIYHPFLAHILKDGSLDTTFNLSINNSVNCLTTDGQNLYFGGNFSSVNDSVRNYAAAINLNNNHLIKWSPSPNDDVFTMLYSKGKIYMGGYFTTVLEKSRSYAAAVKTNNELTGWNPTPNSPVTSMACSPAGSSLYLCGGFNTIRGIPHPYICKVNSFDGTPYNWNPNPNYSIQAIAIYKDRLYVGGYFSSINGVSKQHFAELDTLNGSATSFQADADSRISTLFVSANKLYIGGYFTQIKNKNISYCARINLQTDSLDNWDPAINGTVTNFNAFKNNVLLTGDFSLYNTISRKGLACIDLTTNKISAFNPQINLSVESINGFEISKNELFVAGQFYYNDSTPYLKNNILVLDTAAGIISRTFNKYPVAVPVNAIKLINNKLFVGGDFSLFQNPNGLGSINKSYLASYDLNADTLTSDSFEPDNFVNKIISDSHNGFICAGTFNLINTIPKNQLCGINLITGDILPFSTSVFDGVNSMAIRDSVLFVGGYINMINHKKRNNLAAISLNSGMATNWQADANSVVNTIAIDDTLLYATGNFKRINNVKRWFAGSVSINSGSVFPWKPFPEGDNVNAIAFNKNNVFLGGSFQEIHNHSLKNLASVDKINGNLNAWTPNPDGYVSKLLVDNNTLYVAGAFKNISNQQRNGLAAFNLSDLSLTSFNPSLTDTNNQNLVVRALALYGQTIYLSSYSLAGIKCNNQERGALAGLNISNQKLTNFDPEPNDIVRTLSVSKTKLITGGNWQSLDKDLSHSYFAVYTLPPFTSSSSLSFSNKQSNSVDATWTNGNGESRLVIVQDGDVSQSPSDGKQYVANNIYKQGSKIGSGYVVYGGSSNSINVTNLKSNHTYYFSIYEYNGNASEIDYLGNSPLTGNVTIPDTHTTVGKKENVTLNKSDINVYPNPSTGYLTVECYSRVAGTIRLKVVDVNGKAVYNTSANIFQGNNTYTLNLYSLLPGSYILELNGRSVNAKVKFILVKNS